MVDDGDVGNVPEFADVCYICGDDGKDDELLVCDNCDYKIAHLKCLGFSVVPKEAWHCTLCQS